jgi:hypothetical protein
MCFENIKVASYDGILQCWLVFFCWTFEHPPAVKLERLEGCYNIYKYIVISHFIRVRVFLPSGFFFEQQLAVKLDTLDDLLPHHLQ